MYEVTVTVQVFEDELRSLPTGAMGRLERFVSSGGDTEVLLEGLPEAASERPYPIHWPPTRPKTEGGKRELRRARDRDPSRCLRHRLGLAGLAALVDRTHRLLKAGPTEGNHMESKWVVTFTGDGNEAPVIVGPFLSFDNAFRFAVSKEGSVSLLDPAEDYA